MGKIENSSVIQLTGGRKSWEIPRKFYKMRNLEDDWGSARKGPCFKFHTRWSTNISTTQMQCAGKTNIRNSPTAKQVDFRRKKRNQNSQEFAKYTLDDAVVNVIFTEIQKSSPNCMQNTPLCEGQQLLWYSCQMILPAEFFLRVALASATQI